MHQTVSCTFMRLGRLLRHGILDDNCFHSLPSASLLLKSQMSQKCNNLYIISLFSHVNFYHLLFIPTEGDKNQRFHSWQAPTELIPVGLLFGLLVFFLAVTSHRQAHTHWFSASVFSTTCLSPNLERRWEQTCRRPGQRWPLFPVGHCFFFQLCARWCLWFPTVASFFWLSPLC